MLMDFALRYLAPALVNIVSLVLVIVSMSNSAIVFHDGQPDCVTLWGRNMDCHDPSSPTSSFMDLTTYQQCTTGVYLIYAGSAMVVLSFFALLLSSAVSIFGFFKINNVRRFVPMCLFPVLPLEIPYMRPVWVTSGISMMILWPGWVFVLVAVQTPMCGGLSLTSGMGFIIGPALQMLMAAWSMLLVVSVGYLVQDLWERELWRCDCCHCADKGETELQPEYPGDYDDRRVRERYHT